MTGNKYTILNIHKSCGHEKDTYFGNKTIQFILIVTTTAVNRTSLLQILLQLVFQASKTYRYVTEVY